MKEEVVAGISGIAAHFRVLEPIARGRQVVEGSKTALELLRLSTRSFMQTRFLIREMMFPKPLAARDRQNHARVTFALNDLEAQLQRLEQFLFIVMTQAGTRDLVNLLVSETFR